VTESKIAHLTRLIDAHDLTFMYSDDGGVCRRGQAELDEIRELAKDVDPEVVRKVWDAKVDRHLAEGFREQFYWRG
jgi:hypothetical protein